MPVGYEQVDGVECCVDSFYDFVSVCPFVFFVEDDCFCVLCLFDVP